MIKFFSEHRRALIPGLCCGLLLLSACATTMQTGDSIEKRATARWDALLSGDLAAAYEFLSPGYRSSAPSVQYQRSLRVKRVSWTEATYTESDCTETTCKVKILLNYTLHGVVPGVSSFTGSDVVEESWLQRDNIWYLVPKQ